MQGDIIAILDSSGTPVVQYTYNAWGEILTTTGTLATTLGTHNPLTYRGYVYDWEIGFYYLQSRYYDPTIGRFINADGYASTGQGFVGNNMFAYCGNNPVNRIDSGGTRYCAATSISKETAADRSEAMQFQRKITTNKELRDVTNEVVSALNETIPRGLLLDAISSPIPGYISLAEVFLYYDFYTLVNHEAPWDIKLEDVWPKTIGTTFPGKDVNVSFMGETMTPECIGNYTYGVLGHAYGIPYPMLIVGSYYAAKFPTSGEKLINEFRDWMYITKGYVAAKYALFG